MAITPEELTRRLRQAGRNYDAAAVRTYNETVRRAKPKFNAAARAAAGPDRILSRGPKARLEAKYKIVDRHGLVLLFIDPVGPWGIRDNTGAGGRTRPHVIYPKNASILKFQLDGVTVWANSVSHPGSRRSDYWGRAQKDAIAVAQRRINAEVRLGIEAALSGRMYSTRAITT